MAKSFKDILTDEFPPPVQRPPSDLLDELKDALASKVLYRLDFRISSITTGDRVSHGFRVEVPSLGNYAAELFKVSHKVLEFYPARISGISTIPREVNGEDELRNVLGEYITSDDFKKIIGALLAQA